MRAGFVLSDHVYADRQPLEILRLELSTSFIGRVKSCVRVLPRLPRVSIANRRNLVDGHFSRIISPDPDLVQARFAAQLEVYFELHPPGDAQTLIRMSPSRETA